MLFFLALSLSLSRAFLMLSSLAVVNDDHGQTVSDHTNVNPDAFMTFSFTSLWKMMFVDGIS
jgi:hypothetical protein